MAIDFTDTDEPKLTLSQAARYFVSIRSNRPAHKSRVIRYITLGVSDGRGNRVHLEALRQGNQWVTTPSAIQAFCEALTAGRRVSSRDLRPLSPARRRAADRAGHELDTKHKF